jgi:hypothetical protein
MLTKLSMHELLIDSAERAEITNMETFLEANHSLFPAGFNSSNSVGLMKDCPDAMVSVRLGLTNH